MRYTLALAALLALSTAARAADDRSTYRQVEHEADRGAGRIQDQPTYELDRMRQDRSNPTAAEELRRFDEEQRRRDEIDSTYQRRLDQLLSQYRILPAEPSAQPTTSPTSSPSSSGRSERIRRLPASGPR